MAEISINEYIRTDNGIIDRIIIQYKGKCNNPNCNRKHISCEKNYYDEESIVKHSKNIIDLIEEGDYVNGYKVLYVCNEEPCPSGKYVDIDCNKPSEESYFFEDEIKSIITKEQIKQIEFRIKE